MYNVVFNLPKITTTGQDPLKAQDQIVRDLDAWRKLYGIPYRARTHESVFKYTLTVELALDRDATWFTLTWTGAKYDSVYKV